MERKLVILSTHSGQTGITVRLTQYIEVTYLKNADLYFAADK